MPGSADRASPLSKDARYAEVKVGRHPDHIRIVFTTAEDNVQKAAVTLMTTIATRDTVKIDFPQPVILVLPDRRGVPQETTVEIEKGIRIASSGATCRLIIENLAHATVSRLAAPARLAINAYFSPPAGMVTPVPTPTPAPPLPPGDATAAGQFSQEQEGRVVAYVVDAGHGGYDKGIWGRDFAEKDITLALSKDLLQALTKKGKRAVLTRTGDQNLSITDRTKAARVKSPSVFLSVHLSSSKNFALYIAPPPNQTVLQALVPPGSREELREMSKRYAEALSQYLRGAFTVSPRIEELPMPLLLNARAAAVVLEVPHPDHFRYDARARDKMVQAIANAIVSAAAVPSKGN